MTDYYTALSMDDREDLFRFMRDLDLERTSHEAEARRLYPRLGEVAVGAGHFDPFVRAAVIEEFLSRLRDGETPERARDVAIEYGRGCVRIHNAKRPKDVNWARWEDQATDFVEQIYRRCPRPTTCMRAPSKS